MALNTIIVSNLEWATHAENSESMKLSRVKCGGSKRRVIQYSLAGQPIRVWEGVSEAAYSVNSPPTNISRACRTDTSICCGYRWKYYDEMVKPEADKWKSVIYNGTIIEISNLGRVRRLKGGIIGSTTNDMTVMYA
jgi:hypothetical protein